MTAISNRSTSFLAFGAALVAALCTQAVFVPDAGAQTRTARTRYADAQEREAAVRAALETAGSDAEAARDTLAEARGVIQAYQAIVRRYPISGYSDNALFNAAALAVDGRLAGFAAKQNLAGDGLHYEPRWFKAWPRGRVAEAAWDTTRGLLGDDAEGAGGAAEMLPLGDIYFDVGGVRLGFEICEDAWVAARPGGALSGKAVDIILNPSASHFAFGKHAVRTRLVQEGSRAFVVTYVYSNLLGNEAGRVLYDGGVLIAQNGELLVQGPRLSFRDWS